eukprot:m.109017 g.109017  ORF g.109017 m.109017 type:complete len:197 (-) comp10684_c0_seq2:579-1169(-)
MSRQEDTSPRPSERGRAWDPILITRPLNPALDDCEKMILTKGKSRPEACDNIILCLRAFVRGGDASTALPEHVFRTLAETSRCDHVYGEQMRVVRSRVSERLGNDLYMKTMSDAPLTDPTELDKVNFTYNYYSEFLNGQVKKCLPWADYVKAGVEDSGAAFAAAAGAIYYEYISRSSQVYKNGLTKVEEMRKANKG